MVKLDKIKKSFIELSKREDLYTSMTERTLRHLAEVEKDFGLNALNIDLETLKMLLSLVLRGDKYNISKGINVLKKYFSWAIQNGYSEINENFMNLIDYESIDLSLMYKISYILKKEDLIKFINISFQSNDKYSPDALFVLCIWLVWNGIKLSDVFKINKSEYDQRKGVINYKNRKISLDKECKKQLDFYLSVDYVLFERKSKICTSYKKTSEYLIETTSNNRNYQSVYFCQRLIEANKYYEQKQLEKRNITSLNLLKSGIFYRVNEKFKTDGIINFDEYNYYFKPISKNNNTKALQEFESWKKALESKL